jgi:hypothetical protein
LGVKTDIGLRVPISGLPLYEVKVGFAYLKSLKGKKPPAEAPKKKPKGLLFFQKSMKALSKSLAKGLLQPGM